MQSCVPLMKIGLFGLLLIAGTTSRAQTLQAATANTSETSATWLGRMQKLPLAAQVAGVRERLQADAHRIFRNDPSQMPVCLTSVSAATRVAWEAGRRNAPDTVVHDDRVLCVINGHLLNGPEAATALASMSTRAIQQISFLTKSSAQAVYGTRAAAGVLLVKTR